MTSREGPCSCMCVCVWACECLRPGVARCISDLREESGEGGITEYRCQRTWSDKCGWEAGQCYVWPPRPLFALFLPGLLPPSVCMHTWGKMVLRKGERVFRGGESGAGGRHSLLGTDHRRRFVCFSLLLSSFNSVNFQCKCLFVFELYCWLLWGCNSKLN